MLCWTRIDWSMKMRETSRGVDKKLHVNNNQNKGVVAAILPDDMMPEIEEGPFKGERPDIIQNSMGVLNRLLGSAPIEIELNFISKYIRYYMSQHKTLVDKENELFKYLKLVNNKQYEWTKKFYNTLSISEREEYIEELIENGIPLMQPPFYDNVCLKELTDIYHAYPEIKEFKFKNIKNPIIMGEMYMLTLKHDTKGKMSIRSTGFNNMSGLPAKSKAYRDFKVPYSNTPLRLG